MRSLLTYLECDGAGIFATPGNTMGAGNPGPTGEDTLSEPLAQGMDTDRAKAKKQKTKKKMKDLKDFLKESLLVESNKHIESSAANVESIISFAAKFDVNTKNDEDWDQWDDVSVDADWAKSNKPFIENLCKVCKDIEDKRVDYGTKFLGNYPEGDSHAQQELLSDEFDLNKGDEVYLLTADGDDGMFFYLIADDNTSKKLAEELSSIIIGAGNWDWETCTYEG